MKPPAKSRTKSRANRRKAKLQAKRKKMIARSR